MSLYLMRQPEQFEFSSKIMNPYLTASEIMGSSNLNAARFATTHMKQIQNLTGYEIKKDTADQLKKLADFLFPDNDLKKRDYINFYVSKLVPEIKDVELKILSAIGIEVKKHKNIRVMNSPDGLDVTVPDMNLPMVYIDRKKMMNTAKTDYNKNVYRMKIDFTGKVEFYIRKKEDLEIIGIMCKRIKHLVLSLSEQFIKLHDGEVFHELEKLDIDEVSVNLSLHSYINSRIHVPHVLFKPGTKVVYEGLSFPMSFKYDLDNPYI